MGTFNVLDASGNPQSVTNNGNGQQDAAGSAPVALSTEDRAAINAVTTSTDAINTTLNTPVDVLAVQPMMAEGAALDNLVFSEVRIKASSSGDTALVTATASQNTKVYRFFMMAASAVTVQFRDGSTVLAEFPMAANQMVGLGFEQYPWFTGTDNTAFNINLSSAVSVQGRMYYIKGAS